MGFELSWADVPVYLTIVLTMGLALVLLYLDFQKRANRAFALLLLLRGGALIVGTLRNASTSDLEFEFFQRLLPYFQLAMLPAFVHFLFVYPRPRTWFGRSKWGAWTLFGLALLVELAYAWDHTLYWTFERGASTLSVLTAGHGYRYVDFGPLAILGQLSVPMACIAAIVFGYDYLREPPGRARFSLVLIIAGLLLSSLYFGVQWVFAISDVFTSLETYPWMPWGWGFTVLPLMTLPLAVLAVGEIYYGSRHTPNPSDDVEARRLLLVTPIPVVLAILVSAGSDDVFGDELAKFMLGLWRLVMPVLVTYALLRYRLFDLDVKARITIHYGSVVAIFGIVYFFASETAEGMVSERVGDWAGLAAAAGLTLVVRPLERLGGKLAKRVMPGAKPLHELDEKARQKLYRDQFAMALQDGRLTASERRMLAELQRKLGVAASEPSPRSPAGRKAPPAAIRPGE